MISSNYAAATISDRSHPYWHCSKLIYHAFKRRTSARFPVKEPFEWFLICVQLQHVTLEGISQHVDLSDLPVLTTVSLSKNPNLTSFNVENSPNIEELFFWNSNIQGDLDLSHLDKLKDLFLIGGDVTSLKLSPDAHLTSVNLWGHGNIPLSDIIEFKNIEEITLDGVVTLYCWQENILREINNIQNFSYSNDQECLAHESDNLDDDNDGIINVNDSDDDNDGIDDLHDTN